MGECSCTEAPQGAEESPCCGSSEDTSCDYIVIPVVSTNLSGKDVFGACKVR